MSDPRYQPWYVEPFHTEPFVSKTNRPYLFELRRGKSGGIYGTFIDEEAEIRVNCFPSYKTQRGAIGNLKRQVGYHEDLTHYGPLNENGEEI